VKFVFNITDLKKIKYEKITFLLCLIFGFVLIPTYFERVCFININLAEVLCFLRLSTGTQGFYYHVFNLKNYLMLVTKNELY
jgi:hypothetical protein